MKFRPKLAKPTRPSRPPRVRYLSVEALHHLVGNMLNGRIGSLQVSLLYFQLEAFLAETAGKYAEPVGSIPGRLLQHNAQPRDRILCEMAEIDADVVFDYDARTKRTDLQWKAYFQVPELARAKAQQRVVLHVRVKESDGLTRAISVPLQVLMTGYGDVLEGHQGYAHSITFLGHDASFIDQVFYIGITSRNWLVRMDEHMAEVRGGSNKRFHAAWRACAGDTNVMLASELIVLNQTFEGIMAWEEGEVDVMMANEKSLNMIPGGFKGLRFLHEHRVTDKVNITLEERDHAIAKYVSRVGVRGGVPNLFLAELWRDDAFYLKVLAARSDVLTPGQVLAIRDLAQRGRTPQQIFEAVGARNVEQVQRVLQGKTYARIQSRPKA